MVTRSAYMGFVATANRTANGRAIATIRRLRGLSQSDLAAALDMSDSWMAAVEKGRVRPTRSKLDELARALYCEVEAISFATEVAAS